MQPSQYRYIVLQYRFAVIFEAPSSCGSNKFKIANFEIKKVKIILESTIMRQNNICVTLQ